MTMTKTQFNSEIGAVRMDIKWYRSQIKSWLTEIQRAKKYIQRDEKKIKDLERRRDAQQKYMQKVLKPLSDHVGWASTTRYQMFNEALRGCGVGRIYRDRRKDGTLSVKIEGRVPTSLKKYLISLADESKMVSGTSYYMDEHCTTKVRRYYFSGIPRSK